MRLAAALFTWAWVPLTWWSWQTASSPERGVAFGWFTMALWGASTWTLWQLGVLRRIYGSSDIPNRLASVLRETLSQLSGPAQTFPTCPTCSKLVVPGVDHANCRRG